MNKKWIVVALVAAVATIAFLAGSRTAAQASAPAQKPASVSAPSTVIAAVGRIESTTEEVKIGASMSGRINKLLVDEGSIVSKGQVIAELDNADYAARVHIAEAAVAERRANLEQLLNGSRQMERREAEAQVKEALAVLDNASNERDRRKSLFDKGDISRAEFERYDKDYLVAKLRHEAAVQRAKLVVDRTRPEEIDAAKANIAEAEARVHEARALFDKTIVRAPISGVILRRKLRAGERFSDSIDIPIVTMADTNSLRVRVDVDEADVRKIADGQKAWIKAQALGDRPVYGHVTRVGQILGRKNIRTDEPVERVDQKILETIVTLDGGEKLPLGLRVDVYIDTARRDYSGS